MCWPLTTVVVDFHHSAWVSTMIGIGCAAAGSKSMLGSVPRTDVDAAPSSCPCRAVDSITSESHTLPLARARRSKSLLMLFFRCGCYGLSLKFRHFDFGFVQGIIHCSILFSFSFSTSSDSETAPAEYVSSLVQLFLEIQLEPEAEASPSDTDVVAHVVNKYDSTLFGVS